MYQFVVVFTLFASFAMRLGYLCCECVCFYNLKFILSSVLRFLFFSLLFCFIGNNNNKNTHTHFFPPFVVNIYTDTRTHIHIHIHILYREQTRKRVFYFGFESISPIIFICLFLSLHFLLFLCISVFTHSRDVSAWCIQQQ